MSDIVQKPDYSYSAGFLYMRWWVQVAAFLLVLVECCWILPWFQMVTQITSTAPLWIAGIVLAAIMLVAYAAGYGMESIRLTRNVQIAVFGVLLILSLIWAENQLLDKPIQSIAGGLARLDPGAVLVLFFVIWMWWRGVSLSRGVIRPMTAWRRFELGLLFFMGYIFIASRVGFYVPGLEIFILFLFSGLLAVIFARVSFVGLTRGVRKNPFDLRWMLSVVGVLSATVTLAAFAGGLLSGQYRMLLDFLAEAVKFLIAVGIFILSIPGLLISYLVGPFMPWLRNMFNTGQQTPTPEYPIDLAYPALNLPTQPQNLPLAIQTFCFWGLILLLIVALFLRVRKSLGGRNNLELPSPDSLLHPGEARKLLRKALQDAIDEFAARLRPAQRLIAAARIRRIYAQLMDLCNELDKPRRLHQTPAEFLPEMGELFTALTQDLQTVTDAYVRVRYGELPETSDEVSAIENAWQRIQTEGKRLKRAGVGKLKTVEIKEIERSST